LARGAGELAAYYQDAVKGVLTLSRPASMGAPMNLLRERLGICLCRARAIVFEPKFIDLDVPAPVLVMPPQSHSLRKPVGVPYWAFRDWESS